MRHAHFGIRDSIFRLSVTGISYWNVPDIAEIGFISVYKHLLPFYLDFSCFSNLQVANRQVVWWYSYHEETSCKKTMQVALFPIKIIAKLERTLSTN